MRDPVKWREYMREYMRKYRAKYADLIRLENQQPEVKARNAAAAKAHYQRQKAKRQAQKETSTAGQ